MTRLSADIKTKGLAKNKLLAILFILGAIIVSGLIFGIFKDDKKSIGKETASFDYKNTDLNPDLLLQQIYYYNKCITNCWPAV